MRSLRMHLRWPEHYRRVGTSTDCWTTLIASPTTKCYASPAALVMATTSPPAEFWETKFKIILPIHWRRFAKLANSSSESATAFKSFSKQIYLRLRTQKARRQHSRLTIPAGSKPDGFG